jgi:hypothetical protein
MAGEAKNHLEATMGRMGRERVMERMHGMGKAK